MWVPGESKLDLAPGLKALTGSAVKKIAIANPQHAPYGKAAVAALQKAGIHDAVKNKFVLGENISQTASFAMSGAADVGIIALSLALSPNMKDQGRYVAIPEDQYPPIEQACVILRASKNKAVAQQFLKFMQSPAIADVLRTYGFAVPNSTHRP
jgi:molybdate transport system substrate-binding protein